MWGRLSLMALLLSAVRLVPVRFTGDNFRQETAKRKMESMKKLITD